MLHGLGRVVHYIGLVGAQGDDELSKVDQILPLQFGQRSLSVELNHIHYGAGVETNAVPSGQKDLAWVNDPGSQLTGMDRFQSIGNLSHVTPENLFRDVRVMATLEPVSGAKVLFSQRLRQWVIVGDKDQGAVLKASASKRIVDCHDTTVADTLPSLHGADGLFVRQPETYIRVSILIMAWKGLQYPRVSGERKSFRPYWTGLCTPSWGSQRW